MEITNNAQLVNDRRQAERDKSLWWNKLTVSQKFAANSLSQFGYELSFVRNQNNESLAVMTCCDSVATVNADGDIDSSPDITIR